MFPIFHQSMLVLLALLLWGHLIADYPLQGDFLAKGKDPDGPLKGFFPWTHALGAHAGIHAGFVLLFTGSLHCACIEFIAHAFIDYGKCKKYIGLNTDQALHVACKVLYLFVVFGQL